MLFNSNLFVFVYLPLLALGFYLLGRSTRRGALLWLTLGSLVFYAWWRPTNVLLIAPSILINYGLARGMQRLLVKEDRRATWLLVIGIVFNVLFLGYFKYRNFFYETVNYTLGTDIPYAHLILPLGISFITFQKIAFLIDVHGGRVDKFTLREYFLFVLFFPQLIAGPIVHYREMMPQFRRVTCRFQGPEFSLGVTLFIFGLFKKVVLADSISPQVAEQFQRAVGGDELSLLLAWMTALGYTLQLYFDFSGYSDMALGMGRMFGVRLPPNFDSPLAATNIIDFWRRWHMTLTRFLTAYIYNPLVLSMTRRRVAAGRQVAGGSGFSIGPFLLMVVYPTLLVMLISGIWHGAGFQFVVWGLIHGVYLCINHAWRTLPFVRKWRSGKRYHVVMAPVGFVVTFLAVVVAMVFFGAPSASVAVHVLEGMAGLHGIELPAGVLGNLGPLAGTMQAMGIIEADWWYLSTFIRHVGLIVLLLGLAVVGPNTLQILGWDTAEVKEGKSQPVTRLFGFLPSLRWQGSLVWAGFVAILGGIAVYQIGGPSEFLYWQF